MMISRIYSVLMKILCVQIRGNEKTIRLSADKAEEDANTNELLASRGGQVIGRFNLKDVAGWWLED